jgi:hypothetical protein
MWHDARFWFWMAGAWVVGCASSLIAVVLIAEWLRKRIARKAHENWMAMVREGIITPNEARQDEPTGETLKDREREARRGRIIVWAIIAAAAVVIGFLLADIAIKLGWL